MEAIVFKDVPFARTGEQIYLESEVKENGSLHEKVSVTRSRHEVRKSADSFNFAPVTNDHPSDLVSSNTIESHQVGVVTGVYFDEATEQLKGNFLIWDALAINDIESGKRQLSGGYECDIKSNGGGYAQSNIIGNHVALCDTGRSGDAQRLL